MAHVLAKEKEQVCKFGVSITTLKTKNSVQQVVHVILLSNNRFNVS